MIFPFLSRDKKTFGQTSHVETEDAWERDYKKTGSPRLFIFLGFVLDLSWMFQLIYLIAFIDVRRSSRAWGWEKMIGIRIAST